jgi:uncharacterized protein (DUF169 family)
MNEKLQRLLDTIETHCRLQTAPVAVKLAETGEKIPQKAKYPVAQVGNRLAVCQGMSLARTFGWTMAFGQQDHGCPLPLVFLGHAGPEKFLEGEIARAYQSDTACRQKMEATYPRWPAGRFQEVWLAPLSRCEFTPDLVVVYGNAAQILSLIHGANYGLGTGITSVSTGRYGCSQWLAGAVQAGECTYMVPGPGERIFAGTQDHELSFAVPREKIDNLIEGMEYVRSQGAYRYPVPGMGLLAEPRIPKNYFDILKEE